MIRANLDHHYPSDSDVDYNTDIDEIMTEQKIKRFTPKQKHLLTQIAAFSLVVLSAALFVGSGYAAYHHAIDTKAMLWMMEGSAVLTFVSGCIYAYKKEHGWAAFFAIATFAFACMTADIGHATGHFTAKVMLISDLTSAALMIVTLATLYFKHRSAQKPLKKALIKKAIIAERKQNRPPGKSREEMIAEAIAPQIARNAKPSLTAPFTTIEGAIQYYQSGSTRYDLWDESLHLLITGIDTNLNFIDGDGNNLLHLALKLNWPFKTVKFIVKQKPEYIDSMNHALEKASNLGRQSQSLEIRNLFLSK